MKRTTLLVVSALFVAFLSAAAQQLPKIAFEKYTLANGLQVILHVDKKIPAVNVNLWYHVGSKNERPGKTGFAHLFEHMMFQGSKHVEGRYLALAERAGANLRTGGVNGTTSEDRTNYFETVPSASLEYALWLESDRMGFLIEGMTKEKLANQQDVVKNEKRQGDNSPYSAVQYLTAENLYPTGHPYGHTVIGSIEDLTNASLDDVGEFFKKWYAPNNCTLTLSGDFDIANAKQLVQKYFGPLPAGEPLSRPVANIPTLESNRRVRATDRVPQARIYLIYPVPQMFTPEEAPLDMAAAILGQGKTSWLYKKLVRELELASDVSVRNSSSEISGEFTFTVTARAGKSLEQIKAVVDEQIALFAKTGPDKDDLQREKTKLEVQFINSIERIGGFGGVADRLGQYNTFLGDPDYFQKDFDRYQAVTPEQVKNEFAKWIAAKHRLEIAIDPETSGRPDAKEFDRSAPANNAPVVFTQPVITKKTLANGLEVVVTERHDLPLLSATLLIKSGNLMESDANAGESSMTAAMLDEGTAKRNALQIKDDLDKYGSSLNTGGGKQGASASISCLKKYLDPTFDIMADVVLHPAFPADEFDRQKKQAVDGIARQKANPAGVASTVFNKMLFGGTHPLGISSGGTETSVKALTLDNLKKNYQTYWRPNNAALVFAGDITMDEAVKIAEKYFGSWKKGDVASQKMPSYPTPSAPVIYLVDKQNAPQSQIRIGSTGPDRSTKDYYNLIVMNTLLGGGFSSRLNMNLREEKGYTYGANSGMVMAKTHGYWVAAAGVQTKVTKEALVEFKKEINGIDGSRPVTEDEVDGVRKNLTRGYVQNFESVGMLLGQVTPLVSDDLPFDEIGKYIPAVDAQTPASVMEMGKKYIDFNKSVIVVVGDLSKIEEGIRSLNWGKVVVVDEDGKVLR